MSKQNKIKDLLNKKMDRKDFLRLTGASLLGVVGINNIVKTLSDDRPGVRNSDGYGASVYGGNKIGKS